MIKAKPLGFSIWKEKELEVLILTKEKEIKFIGFFEIEKYRIKEYSSHHNTSIYSKDFVI